MTPVIGLDIGGANLKAAMSTGQALSQNFDLWRTPERLAEMLSLMLGRLPAAAALAVTMTGELADCFSTKSEGVDCILRSVEQAAGSIPVLVWQTSGSFISPDQARQRPLDVAAANWHALATWAGRFARAPVQQEEQFRRSNNPVRHIGDRLGPADREGKILTGLSVAQDCPSHDEAALLVDIGSTTSDLIPLWNGVPAPLGRTDVTRLLAGELIYTGVRRTPLCAVAQAVPYRGRSCAVAAELFATTLDVYLTLGRIAEDPADTNTANGRPATKPAARDRLARMICCDRSEFSAEDAAGMSVAFAAAQQGTLNAALENVLKTLSVPCTTIILSGSGSFLAEELVSQHPALQSCRIESLSERFSPALAEAGCAYAVAVLASETIDLMQAVNSPQSE